MTWLAWRQFRSQAWVGLILLAVVAIILAATGPGLAHLYNTSGIPGCHAHRNCGALSLEFVNELRNSSTYRFLAHVGVILIAVPALIGIFWGAPLIARELEAGTYRLAWNQSVTRSRWLAMKLGVVGLASIAAAGLFSLMVTWYSSPVDRARSTMFSVFAQRGIVPMGYAAFAFALGVTAGLIFRRTVPAMAVTLALFAVVQLVVPQWVRPHLLPPAHKTETISRAVLAQNDINRVTGTVTINVPARHPAGAWTLSRQVIAPSGRVFTGPAIPACKSGPPGPCVNWLASQHLRQLLTYQPSSRFWAFQGLETGIYLILALILAGVSLWWLRRRFRA
jgi:hypothetical protein